MSAFLTLQDDTVVLSEKYDDLLERWTDLGRRAWEVFRRSPAGRMLAASSFLVGNRLERADELFQCGFGCRFLMEFSKLDGETQDAFFETAWSEYLSTCTGQVLLGGAAYPGTPPETLAAAKCYFKVGFEAAGPLISISEKSSTR